MISSDWNDVGVGTVLVNVVRAEAAAAMPELIDRRQGQGGDRHQVVFRASVDDPHELGPVGGGVLDQFVGDHQQAAAEERQHRVGEAEIGR